MWSGTAFAGLVSAPPTPTNTHCPFVKNQTPAGFADLLTGAVAFAGQFAGGRGLVGAPGWAAASAGPGLPGVVRGAGALAGGGGGGGTAGGGGLGLWWGAWCTAKAPRGPAASAAAGTATPTV